MRGKNVVGVLLLVVGIILIIFGFSSINTFGEKMHETFAGHHSSTTLWYFIGGAILIILGWFSLAKK